MTAVPYVITEHVQARKGDDDLSCHLCPWILVVDDSDDQLEASRDKEARHQQNAATTISDDNQSIGEDGNDSGGAQNIAHRERIIYIRHGKEICLVSCSLLVPVHCEGKSAAIPMMNMDPEAA